MAGQGSAVSGCLASFMKGQGIQTALGHDRLGGFQDGALSRLAALGLRLARGLERFRRLGLR